LSNDNADTKEVVDFAEMLRDSINEKIEERPSESCIVKFYYSR
jgi:hypothetical protein